MELARIQRREFLEAAECGVSMRLQLWSLPNSGSGYNRRFLLTFRESSRLVEVCVDWLECFTIGIEQRDHPMVMRGAHVFVNASASVLAAIEGHGLLKEIVIVSRFAKGRKPRPCLNSFAMCLSMLKNVCL
jgi:hypothetical protein